MAEEIIVENIAGVSQKAVVVPVQPGGTTLWGYPGGGKSLVMEALALGLDNPERGRVEPGKYAKRGQAQVCGVVVGINAGRITRSGDSDVLSSETFSLSDLIDPPLKETGARNRHGIKSLLRMSGAKADPTLFHSILGGKDQFEAVVSPEAAKAADMVDMAGKIKRSIEAKSRDETSAAEREEGKAAADRNAGDGMDLTTECDAGTLQASHTAAVTYHARLSEQARAYREAVKARKQAEESLAKSAGEYKGPTIEQAAAEESMARAKRDTLNERVVLLEKQLQEAQGLFDVSQAELTSAVRAKAAAQAHDNALLDANKALASTLPKEISHDLVDMAADEVQDAQQAIEAAAVIRAAKERIERAKQHQDAAEAHRKEAFRLREAAKATDDILSQAVASTRFSVLGEILIGKLPDGSESPFYRMSGGERTMIGVAEKIERVRKVDPSGNKLAMILVEQEIAQELPPSVWDRLFAMAEERNACIIRAMVDDGPLRCEVWGRKEAGALA